MSAYTKYSVNVHYVNELEENTNMTSCLESQGWESPCLEDRELSLSLGSEETLPGSCPHCQALWNQNCRDKFEGVSARAA